MRITMIHGQNHKGSTYHISKIIFDGIADENTIVHEFFLPKDAPDFCVGCAACILKGEQLCPQTDRVKPIEQAMEQSDIVILDSPTYALEMSGHMKTLLDHLCYMWLPHRPKASMFSKIGITVSTTAGVGARGVAKLLKKQLFWMGVPKIYSIGQAVSAISWDGVSDKTKRKIANKTAKIIAKVKRKQGKAIPGIRQRFLFNMMRLSQKSNTYNATDKSYWQENGWIDGKKPW